jgi:hypothetical protein
MNEFRFGRQNAQKAQRGSAATEDGAMEWWSAVGEGLGTDREETLGRQTPISSESFRERGRERRTDAQKAQKPEDR